MISSSALASATMAGKRGKGSLPHHFVGGDRPDEGPTRSRSPPREVHTVTHGPSVTVTETPTPDGVPIRTTTTATDDSTRTTTTVTNVGGGRPETRSSDSSHNRAEYYRAPGKKHDGGPGGKK